MLPPTELTLSHHFRNCGTFNCDPVKEASGQRMGDAARARFRSPVDVAEGVETQNVPFFAFQEVAEVVGSNALWAFSSPQTGRH